MVIKYNNIHDWLRHANLQEVFVLQIMWNLFDTSEPVGSWNFQQVAFLFPWKNILITITWFAGGLLVIEGIIHSVVIVQHWHVLLDIFVIEIYSS